MEEFFDTAKEPSIDVSQIRLYNLLERALPPIRLKQGPTKSTHTSGHKPIDDEIKGQDLKVVSGLVEFLKEKFMQHDIQSTFLLEMLDEGNKDKYYRSDMEIQTLIGYLLRDIIRLILLDNLSVVQETYVPHAQYFGDMGDDSDFWMIYRDACQPMVAVVVKSPHEANVLSDSHVVGQICDYMLDIASFYGQRDVFGITTNGREWKFHWFPSSDDAAKAPTVSSKGTILNEPPPRLSRSVCSTNPISQQDPLLVPLLLSVIFKSVHSPTYKVPLISPIRNYITLSEDSWSWSLLNTDAVDLHRLTIDVTPCVDSCSEYVVLNHLVRNRQQLVWIALAGSTSRIVVIKQFTQEHQEKAYIERSIWQTVNNAHCSIRKIRGLPSLVMPLVFHAQFDEKRGIPFFNCDLLCWLFPTGVVPDTLPESLVLLRKAMMEAGAIWETRVVDAAKHAVDALARHKVVHDDMEWRHFTLMPQFTNGTFYQFTPIMIDFANSHCVESEVEATTVMMNRLNALMKKHNMTLCKSGNGFTGTVLVYI